MVSSRPRSRRSRGSHSRHGRALRSSVAGPHLPQLTGRIPRFHQVVGETLGFLHTMIPEQMQGIRVLIAPMPTELQSAEHLPRWRVEGPKEVVLYRIPIERSAKLPLSELDHQPRYREYVEHTVMLAINEMLDGNLGFYLHGHD